MSDSSTVESITKATAAGAIGFGMAGLFAPKLVAATTGCPRPRRIAS